MTTYDPQNDLGKYFPKIDPAIDDLSADGYIFANISIFDHWLTETEASECEILTYAGALANQALAEYVKGERKFLDFYALLARDGVICNRPNPIREIASADEELKLIFTNSLRERRFMDVFFIAETVRVMGRWDRTDLVFFQSVGQMRSFQEKVHQAGLFLLPDVRSATTH
ncbi:hypothetical protein [Massilia eurypsychrophila]|uniref:hypothetical protein n=1 Tax=Massilia eurypsychrophila TaxID=1485217 RepID=UPI001039811F|nr:hypothetical protein [Massilia eurypsychrophila]